MKLQNRNPGLNDEHQNQLTEVMEVVMRKIFLTAWTLIVLTTISPAENSGRRFIDLTYPFSEKSIYWPTAMPFQHKTDFEGIAEKGYYYSSYSFSASEHGGTHLDAPIHFAKGMATVDQIPLDRLVVPGVLVDVQKQVAGNRDYQITAQDLISWEKQNGRIPDNCIILFRTGWGKFYSDKTKYLGTDKTGQEAVANLHFPGIGPSAAQWIVTNRSISGIGIDTASIDYGQSQLFETHQILYKQGMIAIENVAHMDELPVKDFEIIALPMKIEGGSGAPVRIIAILE